MDRKLKEQISDSVNNLWKLYKEICSGYNAVFMLIDSRVIYDWHTLNENINKFFRQKDEEDIEELLFELRLCRHYGELVRKFDDLFQKQIQGFNNDHDYLNDVFPSEDCQTSVRICQAESHEFLDFYKDAMEASNLNIEDGFHEHSDEFSYCDDEGVEQTVPVCWAEDAESNKCIPSAIDFMRSFERLHKVWVVMASYLPTVLSKRPRTEELIRIKLEKTLLSYSKEEYENVHHDLKKIVKQIKRSERVCDVDAWKLLYEKEDDSYELAINNLIDPGDEIYDYYDEDTVYRMLHNPELLNSIKNNDFEDELFDIEQGIKKGKLLTHLSDKNLDLFLTLVLRRNIIKSEAFPGVKLKFKMWIERDEVSHNKETVESEINNTEQEELFHFVHPNLFGNDEKMKEVHNKIKGLVKYHNARDICIFLNGLEDKEEVFLPSSPQSVHDELLRMGLPKQGCEYKTFAGPYKQILKKS